MIVKRFFFSFSLLAISLTIIVLFSFIMFIYELFVVGKVWPSKYLIYHIYPSPQFSVSFEREERKACRKDIGHVKEIRARGKNATKNKKGKKISNL